MITFITVVLAAIIFEYSNGFHAWVLTLPATALLGYILSRAAAQLTRR